VQIIQQLVERARETEHGFKDLEAAAVEVRERASAAKGFAASALHRNIRPRDVGSAG